MPVARLGAARGRRSRSVRGAAVPPRLPPAARSTTGRWPGLVRRARGIRPLWSQAVTGPPVRF